MLHNYQFPTVEISQIHCTLKYLSSPRYRIPSTHVRVADLLSYSVTKNPDPGSYLSAAPGALFFYLNLLSGTFHSSPLFGRENSWSSVSCLPPGLNRIRCYVSIIMSPDFCIIYVYNLWQLFQHLFRSNYAIRMHIGNQCFHSSARVNHYLPSAAYKLIVIF